MNKLLKFILIFFAGLIALFICFILWLKCNPLPMGGGPIDTPAYCHIDDKIHAWKTKIADIKNIREIKKNSEFTCIHEQYPPLSEETQKLYLYALYRDLNHILQSGERGDGFWDELLPYYRIAAANGDYKANIRLRFLLGYGYTQVSDTQIEIFKLNKLLQNQLPHTAYYPPRDYIPKDYSVISAPRDIKFTLLRKGANMGSKEAQFMLAEKIARIHDEPTRKLRLGLMLEMYQCASEQGQEQASLELGSSLQYEEKYDEAVKAFHQGVKNGNFLAASSLANGFKDGLKEGDNNFLNLQSDAERSRRYDIISDYLSSYGFMSPKVPDLDDIVPLPPAPLPKWDGKIAFQRWLEGEEPPKPSDELMKKLANQAKLDVRTGLPIATQVQPEKIKISSAHPHR